MSKILNIDEVYNIDLNDRYSRYDGFVVETEEEEIYFVIQNGQQCCENWGVYLYTVENLKDYIGAEYLGYSENSCDQIIKDLEEEYVSSNETCFLNIHTSKGDIDFAVYNSHNGYYAHTVILKITNKKTGEVSLPINTCI